MNQTAIKAAPIAIAMTKPIAAPRKICKRSLRTRRLLTVGSFSCPSGVTSEVESGGVDASVVLTF